MPQRLKHLIGTDAGQDLVEYALLVGIAAFLCLAGVVSVGAWLDGGLTNTNTQLRSDGGV